MRKRILITGGAGFLGSHFCEHFLNEGNDVIEHETTLWLKQFDYLIYAKTVNTIIYLTNKFYKKNLKAKVLNIIFMNLAKLDFNCLEYCHPEKGW